MIIDKYPLFNEFEMYSFLEQHEQEMYKVIESIDSNSLLNKSTPDWCDYFEQNYQLEAPKLIEENITTDHREILVPIQDRFGRGTFQASGTEFIFFIPFEGDKNLFRYQPSRYTAAPPYGKVRELEKEIIVSYKGIDLTAQGVQTSFKGDLSKIKDYLSWVRSDISSFNASIRQKIQTKMEFRRQKILNAQGIAVSLGFPLRKRDNAPQTYVSPTVRRKVSIPRSSTSTDPFVPEPSLDIQEYEHILSVISNMVMVMERSPKAFKGMEEEDLRQHFLVQLNGQYEGQATGETFNYEGKTDILIRDNGKNIFIAECKFWRGEENFKETLEQVLGYASWRDTKLALLIFNRNKDFSNVVGQIPGIIKSHSNFKRELSYKSETGFRCVVHHRDDVNRELILTTLAFNVPH